MSKLYGERDIMALDDTGGYYMRHVMAMTGEGLHSKSAIAAELGYRDMQVDALTAQAKAAHAASHAIGLPAGTDITVELVPAIKGLLAAQQDHARLVRELDVLLNGEAEAAKQASLCDIVAQVAKSGVISRSSPAPEGWQIEELDNDCVAVRKDGVGSYVASFNTENIASTILHALASDMLAAAHKMEGSAS